MSPSQPVAAQYCATFLKPEMLHLYRQIVALRAYRPVVLARKRENAAAFPFEPVVLLPRPWNREVRRFWGRRIARGPVLASSCETRLLAAELQKCGAALLHIYFGNVAVNLLPFLRKKQLPTVVSFHGADAGIDLNKPAHVAPLREVLARAALILARSEALADDLADLGCPREKLRVHRTGIPLESFPFVQRHAPADGAWRLIQSSRLIPKKGVETSLRAFAQFANAFPAARFTIAGEGPLLADLRQLASTLGIADRVTFAGFLPQTELLALYERAHLFLHPSATTPAGDREGVPNSMLEAMATGLPAMATRHGGIPEAVQHDLNGLLVAEGAAGDLAAAMTGLARDPERYAAMSEEAARAIGEEWEIHAQTRRLEAFYDEARQK